MQVIEDGVEYTYRTYSFDRGETWFVDCKVHRVNDYAMTYADGGKGWYLNGELVYSDQQDNTANFDMTEKMAMSIIKYRLSK